MVLGYLLARAGIDVVVLEKHGDFLRDFRGDTIHPSTLEVMHELGILSEFIKRPHEETRELRGYVNGVEVPIADFSHVPTHCKFIVFMPQWDFLDFMAEHARHYPSFHLRLNAEATDLILEDGVVVGVAAKTQNGPLEVRAHLTIGADGRHSTVRARSGLTVDDLGAPIDVLWMRLSRKESDPSFSLGRFVAGKILVMLNRETYWQCAFVIAKGGYEEVRKHGLEWFRAQLVEIAPFLSDRVSELTDWDQIKLLTVAVDRLRRWYRPGLLCIGDSAHAMSPIGGVGINLAIQDAVATANLLAQPLKNGQVTEAGLAKVEARRTFPTWFTQRLQVVMQNRVISRVLASGQPLKLPWILKLFQRWPFLRRIPARLIGVGVRPEHVKTPAAVKTS
jgi:2-polyprenyl-6-methoxyphenol hydroxylase-like FAD-dependent oxidoreductase